jgi:putative hemolysin
MNINAILIEAVIIALLILLNGILAMSEMAIVSAKKIRLLQFSKAGNSGAQTALELAADPSSFLASIQIGITLIGILAGAFGGATIAAEITNALSGISWLAKYSNVIGLGTVVVSITFLSLIIGELVPKRIALENAEKIALMIARPLRFISMMTHPAVKILSFITEKIINILGIKPSKDHAVTEEDVTAMVDQGTEVGAFEKEEGSIIKRVIAFGDRKVSELMTQRHQMIMLDINASFNESIAKILETPHENFPVFEGTPDHIVGVVSNKCILDHLVKSKNFEINFKACLLEPLFVPQTLSALKILERFKYSGQHLALVIDEYGGVTGIITLTDLLESIVGDLPITSENGNEAVVTREDGSLLIDGMLTIFELKEHLGLIDSLAEYEEDFQTIGGFVMHSLGRIPRSGEHFEWQNFRFEVLDMDGHRVDKVLVSSITKG